jgi:hypothetical protein
MNKSQETICKIISQMLTNEYFKDNCQSNQGFKHLFDRTIRQYAETLDDGKKTVGKIDLCKKHHQITNHAEDIFLNKKGCLSGNDKNIHYEHIVPISIIMNELLLLKSPNFQNVCEIMKHNEVIIISNEKRKILDSTLNMKDGNGALKNTAIHDVKNTRLRVISGLSANSEKNNLMINL